jgi:hypothetical protein
MSVLHNTVSAHCLRKTLENGVYVFRFTVSSRRAVDEWLIHLDTIYEHQPSNKPVRYIIDYTATDPLPVSYAAQRCEQWLAFHPNFPPTRIAFLQDHSAIAPLVNSIARLLRPKRASMRFFSHERRDEAMRWLIAS